MPDWKEPRAPGSPDDSTYMLRDEARLSIGTLASDTTTPSAAYEKMASPDTGKLVLIPVNLTEPTLTPESIFFSESLDMPCAGIE